MSMTNDEVVERLDRVIAILALANEDAIERARKDIRTDEINSAILELTATSVAAGELLRAPNKKRFWDAVVVDGVYGETSGQ
jgi:hypothetical protein